MRERDGEWYSSRVRDHENDSKEERVKRDGVLRQDREKTSDE